ncbi:hypothetical protein FVEG_04758 [Fusarium verticillioides 7600]|uniref:Uncharacterized protein n=1 Tax=Gibberella moniliformis (strain M3125 / FGSC 7600) TaxID=334819 RepID=W7LV96_GIBM7|nr:hypothetical protein FVEG_04758 [Fusarium verticillioides 7600]XP_018749365.1 hypothetical protein FVEG_04758 [Fusarium verticillioides 7600]EWG43173.1 hypothetical protein FVEG_04758 [Fusarium verticillioides 7600]EWG43174.1 hypothetical protein FVEG_04758 [Fusarium verticillioides 7600]
MASVDTKNDYSMEAGLLSTDREERTMSSKEALLQDSESAQTIPRTKTRRISPAGKALIALAACCLLGAGVASIGGATRFCPGHLRHSDVGKHGMNAHRPNLSDSMAQMVRRQNTPPPTDTAQGTDPTDAASDGASNAPSGGSSGGASGGASNTVQQPTATADEPTNEASKTAVQPSATAGEPTDQASATDEASNTQAQPSATQPSATSEPSSPSRPASSEPEEPTSNPDTGRPSATAQPTEDSATEASPSATESQEEPTQPASSAASTQRTTRRTTENRPSSTQDSSPESTTDDSEATATDQETVSQTDEASRTSEDAESATETKSARSTVTGTGTRRTSSAVPKTFTSTLEDGGITTLTSTSWVEVVPSAENTAGSDPDLQNAAPRSAGSVLAAVVGMVFGGFILL